MRRFLVVFGVFWALGAHAEMAEPEDYHGEPYRGEVPLTLEGAEVVSNEEALELWEQGVGFVDVLPHAPKPDLPEGTIWNEKKHFSIPGAIWLPNVGYEKIAKVTSEYFTEGLQKISKDDNTAPLVIFCQAECWMSWNAAKRAMEYGYENIYWYPEGVTGWEEMLEDAEEIRPWEMGE